MRRVSSPVLLACLISGWGWAQSLHPRAVPLVTHDPYFSIWSMADNLTQGPTVDVIYPSLPFFLLFNPALARPSCFP